MRQRTGFLVASAFLLFSLDLVLLIAAVMPGSGMFDPELMKEMATAVPIPISLLGWTIMIAVRALVILGMGKALNLKLEAAQAFLISVFAGVPGLLGIFLGRAMAGNVGAAFGLGLLLAVLSLGILFVTLMTMAHASFGQAFAIVAVGWIVGVIVGLILGFALYSKYTAPVRQKMMQQMQERMQQRGPA